MRHMGRFCKRLTGHGFQRYHEEIKNNFFYDRSIA
jgi:hypothetical protein